MCYVGLDAGTTGIKALAFDKNGMVLEKPTWNTLFILRVTVGLNWILTISGARRKQFWAK